MNPNPAIGVLALLPLLTERPTFSVLMPVYETPEEYLRAAIDTISSK